MKTKLFFLLSILPAIAMAQNVTVNGDPLKIAVGIQGAVELEFNTEAGGWYQVLISMNGEIYDNEGYSIKGTGGLVSTVASTRNYDTAYYRVIDGADPKNAAPWPIYTGIPPIGVDASNQIGINPATVGYILKSTGTGWVAGPPDPTSFTNVDNMQPWLGVNFIIAIEGVFPSRSGASPFIAEIIMFGGNFAPRGWALCDGQLLPIGSYSALFSLLGTTYGGDGRTTFALPDMRGRVPVHAGQGPGLSNRRLGQKDGTESNSHNH